MATPTMLLRSSGSPLARSDHVLRAAPVQSLMLYGSGQRITGRFHAVSSRRSNKQAGYAAARLTYNA